MRAAATDAGRGRGGRAVGGGRGVGRRRERASSPGLGLLSAGLCSRGPGPRPRAWALGVPGSPSEALGLPPAPKPTGSSPNPHPSRRPRDLGPPAPSLQRAWAPLRPEGHSLPSHRPPPLCPWGPAPGLRCPGRRMADRPGPPGPWAPGSTLCLTGTATATARLSGSARPAAPHTGRREAPRTAPRPPRPAPKD